MSETSGTCDPQTSKDLSNVTFSEALADGLTHSGWLTGPMTDPSGREAALASHSVVPAKAEALTTNATYGPLFGGSSPSVNLQRSLASRLFLRSGWKAYVETFERLAIGDWSHPWWTIEPWALRTGGRESTGLPTVRESIGHHMICWKRAESGNHRYQLEDYLAFLWLADGGERIRGLNVNPLLCAAIQGYPECWLGSGMRSNPKSRRNS